MSNKYFSAAEITNIILDLEVKYNLLEWQIGGIFVWQSARVKIYQEIHELISSQTIRSSHPKFTDRIKVFYQRAIINAIVNNPFLDFRKDDVLVFESERNYLIEDKYIDIYTKYLCDDLETKNVSYKTYQSNYLFDMLSSNKNGVKHLDFIFIFSKLISKFINVKIVDQDIKRIKNLKNQFEVIFGIKMDLLPVFIQEIKTFKSKYPFYYTLFRIKRAKKAYIINSCHKAPLIKAAKDNNMIVVELQHGLMAKESIIQHFPNTIEDSLEYFPHIFYIWKNLNMNTSKLPLSIPNIVPFKNKHLQYTKNKYRNIVRNENQILVVSQPKLSKRILKFLLNNLDDLNGFNVIYKLHPTEEQYFYIYHNINQLEEYNNLIIVDNKCSIYKLFAESKYVIGVYSAALFEACYFGCEVLLLNLPGVEMASSLVERGKAKLLQPDEKLLRFL
ncbi:hypothetical protein ACFL0H_11565 [Thermodesulfobacteriota bacterium]